MQKIYRQLSLFFILFHAVLSKAVKCCVYFFLFMISSFPAFAIESRTLSIEADPLPFILGGFGLHVRSAFSPSSKWIVGVGGAASIEMPDAFIELDSKNKGRGWDVKMKSAIGFHIERYGNEQRDGWFVGGQTSFQNFQIRNNNSASDFGLGIAMLHTGYLWYPSDTGFYIKSWAGLGYQGKLSGNNSVGDKAYHINSLLPFATAHFGYRF